MRFVPELIYFNRTKGKVLTVANKKIEKVAFEGQFFYSPESAVATLTGKRIMVVGGVLGDNFSSAASMIWLRNKEVEVLSELPIPCKEGQLHEIGEWIYYIGALQNGPNKILPAPILRYSHSQGLWQEIKQSESENDLFQFSSLMQYGSCVVNKRILIFGGMRVFGIGMVKYSKKILSIKFNDGVCIREEGKLPIKIVNPLVAAGEKHGILIGGANGETGEPNKSCFYFIFKGEALEVHSIDSLSIPISEKYPPVYTKNYAMFILYPNVAIRFREMPKWFVCQIKNKIKKSKSGNSYHKKISLASETVARKPHLKQKIQKSEVKNKQSSKEYIKIISKTEDKKEEEYIDICIEDDDIRKKDLCKNETWKFDREKKIEIGYEQCGLNLNFGKKSDCDEKFEISDSSIKIHNNFEKTVEEKPKIGYLDKRQEFNYKKSCNSSSSSDRENEINRKIIDVKYDKNKEDVNENDTKDKIKHIKSNSNSSNSKEDDKPKSTAPIYFLSNTSKEKPESQKTIEKIIITTDESLKMPKMPPINIKLLHVKPEKTKVDFDSSPEIKSNSQLKFHKKSASSRLNIFSSEYTPLTENSLLEAEAQYSVCSKKIQRKSIPLHIKSSSSDFPKDNSLIVPAPRKEAIVKFIEGNIHIDRGRLISSSSNSSSSELCPVINQDEYSEDSSINYDNVYNESYIKKDLLNKPEKTNSIENFLQLSDRSSYSSRKSSKVNIFESSETPIEVNMKKTKEKKFPLCKSGDSMGEKEREIKGKCQKARGNSKSSSGSEKSDKKIRDDGLKIICSTSE
ncbi:hypothetical protein SteCoe_4586 [Stentor coeruleus]|uniref:Uncharacterized protein n=1 Tax=Stentor coeruleus TaxID=5963 RepID=A0A1R2CU88_9CILI|nr:hypothetical protein SteCoe_4586 [Stentor coeruleus]